ncbi:B12-binding domain-containing radical SAM protein [Acidobacteriota bacterium]
MRVCFINQTLNPPVWTAMIPHGIAYITAVLEKDGHEVIVVDRDVLLRTHNLDMDQVNRMTRERLENFQPDIVALSATTFVIHDAYITARIAKEVVPGCTVIIGGIHATMFPEITLLECEDIDVLGRGEGEAIMLDLANGIEKKSIQSLSWRSKDGKVINNPSRETISNLDILPFPDLHLFDMEYYLDPRHELIRGIQGLPGISTFAARGCPSDCKFCAGYAVFGKRVRTHSPGNIADEMEYVYQKYRNKCFYFSEDQFLASPRHAKEVMKEFRKRRLNEKTKWCAQIRVNMVTRELLEEMKDSGCIQVEFGFESASQRVLDLMRKRTTVEQNYKGAEMANEVGIRFLANIIAGFPGERKEDLLASKKFLVDVEPEFTAFWRYAPLPGTASYNELVEAGRIDFDWKLSLFTNLENFTEMSDDEFNELYTNIQEEIVEPLNLKYRINLDDGTLKKELPDVCIRPTWTGYYPQDKIEEKSFLRQKNEVTVYSRNARISSTSNEPFT